MKNLTQDMILQCVALTQKPGPFADIVYLRPPATMHELKLRAINYIRIEEMKTLHTGLCADYQLSDHKIDKPLQGQTLGVESLDPPDIQDMPLECSSISHSR